MSNWLGARHHKLISTDIQILKKSVLQCRRITKTIICFNYCFQVNKFISVPKDKGSLNCATFNAGIIEAVLTKSGFVSIYTDYDLFNDLTTRNTQKIMTKSKVVSLSYRR